MDGEGDDPVVKTMPVFISTQNADKLALLQYLSRPPCLNNPHPLLPPSLREKQSQIDARIKPLVGQVELSIALEVDEGTREGRYSRTKAVELGRGVSKPQEGKRNRSGYAIDQFREAPPLSKMNLRGELVPDQTNYCAAIVKNDEIHLTSLRTTMHMLPHLSYIDNIAAMEKQAKRGGQKDDSEEEDGSDSESGKTKKKRAAKKAEDAKAVQVSMKMSDSAGNKERSNGRATAALFAPLRAAEAEAWTSLRHYNSTTLETAEVLDSMIAQKRQPLEQTSRATGHIDLS